MANAGPPQCAAAPTDPTAKVEAGKRLAGCDVLLTNAGGEMGCHLPLARRVRTAPSRPRAELRTDMRSPRRRSITRRQRMPAPDVPFLTSFCSLAGHVRRRSAGSKALQEAWEPESIHSGATLHRLLVGVSFQEIEKGFWMTSVDDSRIARENSTFWRVGRVQSSVRPVDAAFVEAAGPDGIRELGPKLQNRLSRLGHSLGCPCSRSDRYAITSLCSHNS